MSRILALLLRFRPTPRMLRGLGQALWTLAAGGWRALVWGDVTEGMVDLRGVSASVRTLARTALFLALALLVSLLFNDVWRAISPLVPVAYLTNSPAPALAPRVLVPITLGLMALAWATMLTGALHSPWWLRLALLGVYGADSFFGLAFGSVAGFGILLLGLQLLALLGIGLLFLFRWRARPRPGLEFPLMLALVGAVAISNFLRAWLVEQDYNSAQVWTASLVGGETQFIAAFLLPFFLIAGMEVAEVALDVGEQISGALRRLAWPERVVAGLLALGLAARLVGLLTAEDVTLPLGALIALAGLALLGLAVRPRLTNADLPEWAPVLAAFVFFGLVLLVTSLLAVAGGALMWMLGLGGSLLAYNGGMALLDRIIDGVTGYNELIVAGFVLILGLWLVWRQGRGGRRGAVSGADVGATAGATTAHSASAVGRRSKGSPLREGVFKIPRLALFAWIFGLWLIWWRLTRPGRLLAEWRFAYEEIDLVLTAAALALLLVWWAGRRLTTARLWWLVGAGLLAALLRVQDFLSDPLLPLFGLLGAQALFISVGVFLGLMSAGGRFQLNEEGERLPRSSRVLLYFGYALFSVAVTNWFWASRQTGQLDLIDLTAQNGFYVIGLPLVIFALIAGDGEKNRNHR